MSTATDMVKRIGQTSGKLTVIDFAGYSQLNCHLIWTCRCQCGRTVVVDDQYLDSDNLCCNHCRAYQK